MAEVELPDPLVPAHIDLRTFDCMPLDVVRLMNSDIMIETTGDQFKAAVILWARSWHQVPAGSLPDDPRKLAHLAGLAGDLRRWKNLSTGALHGWVRCKDGRMYHPLVCKLALQAWAKKVRAVGGANARWFGDKPMENNNSGNAEAYASAAGPSIAQAYAQNRTESLFKKEDRANGSFFVDHSREAARPKRAWSLDEKRNFAWSKIIAHLGGDERAINLVHAAATGNSDAKIHCKAVAKKLKITWYDGMPDLPQAEPPP